jgi:uncharacterized protein DUF885
VQRPGRWLLLPVLVALLSISAGCGGKAGNRSPTLAELLQAYDRETGPLFPFTASERGARQYDRLLANDISAGGQALGYKIGQLKILAVRRKAEAVLGASFDIRAVHDELLRDGAMPLFILEAKMDRWIAAQRRRSGS